MGSLPEALIDSEPSDNQNLQLVAADCCNGNTGDDERDEVAAVVAAAESGQVWQMGLR